MNNNTFKDEIKKVLQEQESAEPKRYFIPELGADPHAAAERFAITENLAKDWYTKVNQTNTRSMPDRLISLYDEAFVIITKIIDIEKSIVLGDNNCDD